MWSLWRSFDRFSLQHFRHLIDELQEVKFVNKLNREFVVDVLRSIVEAVIYGDQHNKSIFECFMEYNILAEFLRVLKISRNSSIEAPLLQFLSIMIQNLASDHAIYYCFSNEYINNIILHEYRFDGGDLVHYYISFLRTVSGKINRDTICLLVKVQEDVVVSFPLYTEALKFAHHEEKMIQIAVRALTLNIYNASDDMVYKFITNPPASEYFSDLVMNLSQKCVHLDALASGVKDTHEMGKGLLLETDKVIDDLYYCNDIIRAGEPCLSTLMTQNLLSSLVLPVLLPSLQPRHTLGSHVSSITSLFILCRLLQVVVGKELLSSVAAALIYPFTVLSARSNGDKGTANGTHPAEFFSDPENDIEEKEINTSKLEEVENASKSNTVKHLSENISSCSPLVSCSMDDVQNKRSGILPLVFSENHSLFLASLMLLLILSESKDLDYSLSSFAGFSEMKTWSEQRVLTALLKVLKRQPPFSVITQWNAGWVLQKLLICSEKNLTDQNIYIFKISFKQSAERLLKELTGSWFDYIPLTMENEWEKCKTVLEESAQLKDPFFAIELSLQKHIPDGDIASPPSQKMVNAVKSFVLHHLLDACIFKKDSLKGPLEQLRSTSKDIRGTNDGLGCLSAAYGSYIDLGSGAPCKIAFSETEQRDVYMIPVAEGISGKLFLVEKLPHHTHQGVVIAIAPLAGLCPETDEKNPTWLHLRIREFDLKVDESSEYDANGSDEGYHGRWTLGFPNAKACHAALSLILEETDKQRASVESLLSPFLQNSSLESVSDDQGE